MKPTPAENETWVNITEDMLQFCGVNDCPGTGVNNTNLAPVDTTTVSHSVLLVADGILRG